MQQTQSGDELPWWTRTPPQTFGQMFCYVSLDQPRRSNLCECLRCSNMRGNKFTCDCPQAKKLHIVYVFVLMPQYHVLLITKILMLSRYNH